MSNPFYGARPVYVPFSGTCDTNGNLTLQLPPLRTNYWTATKMAARVSSGNANWELLVGGPQGGPIDFARGQRCSIASVLLPPNGAPTINVIGAAPGAAMVGAFSGVQTSSPEEAVQYAVLVPSLVGAETAGPPSIQLWDTTSTATPGTASFPTVLAGAANQNFFVNIPPGTRALRILAVNATQGSTAAFTYSMLVQSSAPFQSPPFISGAVLTFWPQGSQGGVLKAPLFPDAPVIVPVEPIWGKVAAPFTTPQVKFIITGDPTVDLQFFISALFDVESVDVTAQQPLPVSQAAASVFNTQPATGLTRTKTGFQAIAAGGTFIIIAAAGGVTLTVLGWAGVIDTSAVGSELQFEDTNGANLLMYDSGSAAGSYQPWTLPRPAVLPVGVGVRARNPSAGGAANIAGTLYTLP